MKTLPGAATLSTVLCLLSPAAPAANEGLQGQPLKAAAQPASSTLFTRVPSTETGIGVKNAFDDPEMWAGRFGEFTGGSLGTGVAVGDFDRDGLPDLFLVSKTQPGRLFRNRGEWKFEDVTERSGLLLSGAGAGGVLESVKSWIGSFRSESTTVIWHQGAAFADINNDGWLDLYLCRTGAPNQLFVNQGNGTFKEEAASRGLAVTDASVMAAWGDFDKDGWLDVFVQTTALNLVENPNGQPDYLFRNRGDGTFEDVTARAGIVGRTLGHSATWWDYNNDGRPDLYVANDFALPDALYRNNGDGTFTNVAPTALPHVPYSGMGSNAADLNNDGLVDLLVADMAATTHEKDQRTMAGARAVASVPFVAPGPLQYPRNALFLGTGTEACREAAYLAGLDATDWTWSVLLDDFDNDGRVDLFVTNGMVREQHNLDLLEQSMRRETTEARVGLMRASPVFVEKNRAYRNSGNLGFQETGSAWGIDELGVSFGGASGDFDSDGDLDLVVSNYDAEPTLFRNNSAAGNRILFSLEGHRSNRFGIGTVVEIETEFGSQVRRLAASHGYQSCSEPVVHFGLGDAVRVRRATVRWPSGVVQTFTDLAAGHRYSVKEPAGVAPAPVPAERAPWFAATAVPAEGIPAPGAPSTADPLALAFQPVRFAEPGPSLAIGDLDGDGGDELLVGASGKRPVQVLVGDPRRGFELRPFGGDTRATHDGPLLIADFSGERKSEVVLTSQGMRSFASAGGEGTMAVFTPEQGEPAGLLSESLKELHVAVGALAAADFDRDGDLDLFVGARVDPGNYPESPRSYLLKNDSGRFSDGSFEIGLERGTLGMVTSALWSDVDADGWLDLLITTEWGLVRCFRNERGQRLSDVTEALGFSAAGRGWWRSVAAGDFNQDGRMDYVVGNAGQNSRYRPTAEHPIVLLRGEFGPRGRKQLIEAYHDGPKLVPWKTRRELGLEIPSVLTRFRTNNDYARAGVAEILGAAKFQSAQRWEADELRSGVFLSKGQGGFDFTPLPREAQLAPATGALVSDFDGDGNADLLLCQNSNQFAPELGPLSGGLGTMLRGDGAGGFTPVATAESGVVIQGFPTGAGIADLDRNGSPDVIVVRNRAAPLTLVNSRSPGSRWLAVRLKNQPGNLAGVGAQLVGTRASGRKSVCEVYAGSGCASQSTATSFFASPKDDPLQRLDVRWPDGSRKTYPVQGREGLLTLER